MNELNRFIEAQESTFDLALNEVKNGKKKGHFMWYILPQLKGLGFSYYSQYYGIKDSKEALMYYEDPVLGSRLNILANIIYDLKEDDIDNVFGEIDSLKLRSSMTLFYEVTKEEIFKKVIDKYFEGIEDPLTLEILKKE